MKTVLANANVHERLTTLGFGTRERADATKWAKVIKESGFQPQ